ncbi:MAG: DUF4091 domain-containing protein [Clostridiaceae bacterium]|nr:DUF4091 domain-containing protein [Clostridiaceae bacterium]
MPGFECRLLSSLIKVFPDEAPNAPCFAHASALRGEVFSFQLAYKFTDRVTGTFSITVEGAADPVMIRDVSCVPAAQPIYQAHDANVLRTKPGLFPDVLQPMDPMFCHAANVWHSAWVTVNAWAPGEQVITLVCTFDGETLARETFTLRVIDAELPAQTLLYTNWFHVDGITGYYGVEPWSERCWTLVESFMKLAAERGMNLILTPVFTPPLDTEVGHERETVQLVDVTMNGDAYTFGFERLRRWIALCRKNGIANLEISHLYTQWGAEHAPKIIATDACTGQTRRIFGWETDAVGKEYRAFLAAFVPELLRVLREEGMEKNAYFHVSDEPSVDHLEQYKNVGGYLKSLIPGFPVMDALSNYDFYATGAVDLPIPATNHIEPFLENHVPNLWTYYCCGQNIDVSNRFLAFPSARNRVLGVQLYKFHIVGFLQWGYNFYNSCLSRTKIDPFRVTDAGEAFPAGDAFVVYPGKDGPLSSIRLEVFHEALQDMRALQLAESLCGRERVLRELEEGIEPITFRKYPHGDAWIPAMRERINQLIASV